MSVMVHKDHAVIHTATIDVKIMRLNKRQITMAVFRQLDKQSIFNVDGTLAGTPWGRVNYTWKGNQNGTGFHVVWQDGEYIKRSPVPYAEALDNGQDWRGWVNCDEYLEEIREGERAELDSQLNYLEDVDLSEGFYYMPIAIAEMLAEAGYAVWRNDDTEELTVCEDSEARLDPNYDASVNEGQWEVDVLRFLESVGTELAAESLELREKEDSLRTGFLDSVQHANELDQLFIAT